MSTITEFLKKYFNIIIKVFALLLAVTLVVYLFPREAKFKYEFSKGKPWMHEDQIAEYNFPIYKTEAELTRERDSILREHKPYFRYDTSILILQSERLDKVFDLTWKSYLNTHYQINQIPDVSSRLQRILIQQKNNYQTFASSLLDFVYSKGIVEATEILEQADNPNFSIKVVKNNVARDHDYSEVFTQKKAYEYVVQQVGGFYKEMPEKQKLAASFFKQLNLNNFIQPNLFYDKETSDKEKESLINQVSLTSGMIQRGERIISRGEVVSPLKFRILESFKKEYELRSGNYGNRMMILFGQIILVSVTFIMLYLFLYHFRREIYLDNTHTIFILLLVTLFVVIAKLTLQTSIVSFYFIPFVILPIIIRTFFDSRLALFIHFILLMLVGFLAPNSFDFVFLNFSAGVVAIFSMTNAYRRGILFLTSVLVFITYSFLYFGLGVIQEGDLHKIEWINLAWFAGNAALILLSYPLIYIFEKTFRFLSDATLFELADTNQPLLRELSEKAPGTFQHSLQVANLSEDACREIGGNPLLVRTAALYHDIGKMKDPAYFIENQSGGINPHDFLGFEESAAIIIGHVTHGIQIARKNKLPEPLINFIRTHHGTTKVQYFYRSFLKNFPDHPVDDRKFSYPGPKPFSKEMVVLMMADSVEAASRSLKEVDHEKIHDLVEKIVKAQFEDGQFEEAPITLAEINRVKMTLKRRLGNIYHVRIEYPEETGSKEISA